MEQEPLALLDHDTQWGLIDQLHSGPENLEADQVIGEILRLNDLGVPVMVPVSTVQRWRSFIKPPVE
jgi:hypothetical protein